MQDFWETVDVKSLILLLLFALFILMLLVILMLTKLERNARELEGIKAILPSPLTPAMHGKFVNATFVILDVKTDIPVACGFFVSAVGFAITSSHDQNRWYRKRTGGNAMTFNNQKIQFSIVKDFLLDPLKLDIAILKISTPNFAPPDHLTLPAVGSLRGLLPTTPIYLLSGSIAEFADNRTFRFGVDSGTVKTSDETSIHHDISSKCGDSGAALVLRGSTLQCIGVHFAGFNDLPKSAGTKAPSISGTAHRLDLQCIHDAI